MNRFLKIYFLILVVFMSAYGLLFMAEASQELVDHKKISLLKEKTVGIEFNPLLFLITAMNDDTYLGGSVVLYPGVQDSEISFPVYFSDVDSEQSKRIFLIDFRYRRFLRKFREGLFVGAGARYYYEKRSQRCGGNLVLNKIGVGLGIGSRSFFSQDFSWGYSFFIGAYLTDVDKDVRCASSLPRGMLVDVEIVKIRYAF